MPKLTKVKAKVGINIIRLKAPLPDGPKTLAKIMVEKKENKKEITFAEKNRMLVLLNEEVLLNVFEMFIKIILLQVPSEFHRLISP